MIRMLRRRPWFAVAGACECALIVWWLGVFPTLVSPDSVDYTRGIMHGYWYLGGSVFYDALEWLSLAASSSVVPLILLQLTSFAAAIVLLARAVHKLGAPAKLVAATAVVVCALPMTGAFVAYLSKDTLFVVGQLLCAAGILELLADDTSDIGWRPARWRRRWFALLITGSVVMTLTRQNGVEMLVVATVVVALLARRFWRPMLAATAVVTATWAAVTFAIAPAAGAVRPDSSLALGPAYGDIGVVFRADPGLFSAHDLTVMARVAPLSWWHDRSTCYASDPLTAPDFVIAAHPLAVQLEHVWLRLVARAPQRIVAARICRGAIAWSVTPVASHTILPPLSTPTNLYRERDRLSPASAEALLPHPPVQWWHHATGKMLSATTTRWAQFALWRGATWCYLAYVAVAVAGIRTRRRAVGAAAALLVANQIVVLVDNPNQLARYMLGCLFLGALLLPLAAARRRLPPTRPGSAHFELVERAPQDA